jgi:hypothetical protein
MTEKVTVELPDDQILALCDCRMDAGQQEELSYLLARNREGGFQRAEAVRLDELMQIYRQPLVRKAQALKVAVARGLKPPLDNGAELSRRRRALGRRAEPLTRCAG